ncbi:ABC-three component system protein [Rhodoferax aquaticus]|jgi:hypothetical protein|uniref:SMEK domain-containing protein n=1 Tax=Rhodoferax aquaticus TaxID=2527691 RepID=A0A515ES78_9BURK|nr:ABC-three component system protein [Rhodoferax aquaticus]QDL55509.1 hypothetical protein EXZ61_15750 [Rhodoferax aquaticus]
MNRSFYWDLCEERLSILCTRVELRGKLNILNFHLHAEDFYVNFLNVLFGYSLKNMNAVAQNAEGIDLIDTVNALVLQVSSTATKTKIESALSKNLAAYKKYRFNFVSISKDASDLRKQNFLNPHGLAFDPQNDIHDVKSILSFIQHLNIDRQRVIYDFLKKELQPINDTSPVETNLAELINILAKEDIEDTSHTSLPIAFDVDKKLVFNNLVAAAIVIEDYKIQHHRIDRMYAIFDSAGQNKSKAVLSGLRQTYIKLSAKYAGDDLFFQVVEHAVRTVQNSANYIAMPLDELEMWINALAVDAFIRCRIFKNPVEPANATS